MLTTWQGGATHGTTVFWLRSYTRTGIRNLSLSVSAVSMANWHPLQRRRCLKEKTTMATDILIGAGIIYGLYLATGVVLTGHFGSQTGWRAYLREIHEEPIDCLLLYLAILLSKTEPKE